MAKKKTGKEKPRRLEVGDQLYLDCCNGWVEVVARRPAVMPDGQLVEGVFFRGIYLRRDFWLTDKEIAGWGPDSRLDRSITERAGMHLMITVLRFTQCALEDYHYN
jgi:hypothetical protein